MERSSVIHQGWVLHHQTARHSANSAVKKWTKYYLVLLKKTLVFYKSDDKSEQNVIGTLALSKETRLSDHVQSDLAQVGYGFQLETLADHNAETRINILMFETEKECNFWKVLILAIAQARPPSNVPLTPAQANYVAGVIRMSASRDVIEKGTDERRQLPETAVELRKPATTVSEKQSDGRQSKKTSYYAATERVQVSNADVSKRSSLPVGRGLLVGQDMERHKFYNNTQLNSNMPTWFVDCTREKAEAILSLSRQYGNVLLRPCSSQPNTKYALSYRSETGGGCQVHHIAVIGIDNGFRVDVTDQPHVLSCLSDVVQYFVTKVGPPAHPLTRNASVVADMSNGQQQAAMSYSNTVNPRRSSVNAVVVAHSDASVYDDSHTYTTTMTSPHQSTKQRDPTFVNDSFIEPSATTSMAAQNSLSRRQSSLSSTSSLSSDDNTSLTSSTTAPAYTTAPTVSPPPPLLPPPPPPAPPPPPPCPILPSANAPSPIKLAVKSSLTHVTESDRQASGGAQLSLQDNLQKELQSKLSKFRKGTFIPSYETQQQLKLMAQTNS